MPREIVTYPLSYAMKQKLITAGFAYGDCVLASTPSSLSKDACITTEEATDVIKLVKECSNAVNIKPYTADVFAVGEQSMCGIVTFSQNIDTMFGDGIPLGRITELCGAPGVGKTQLCMQICVDCTIPECFGGVQGHAIYIDTEGSFVAERLNQMCKSTVSHCQHVADSTKDPEMKSGLSSFTPEYIMKSIHYFRCNSCVELITLTQQLSQLISDNHMKNIKLIVVDSFAFHFRHDWTDMSSRTRVMTSLSQQFMKMASTSKLAVVFVNQMTTKVNGSESQVVPALGESWSHMATNRVLLFWRKGIRHAKLFNSPSCKEAIVPFCVCADGIRDISTPDNHNGDKDQGDGMPRKKQKL